MEKYHAEINFGYGRPPVRFTAVDLGRLITRFTAEIGKEESKRNSERDYTWIEPNLKVEVCSSWVQFDQFEHV